MPQLWMSQQILIIDDSVFYRNMVTQMLHTIMPEAEVTEYDPVMEGKPGPAYHWGQYDALILDYQLGEENGLQWLQDFSDLDDFPVTIFLTGEGNENVAVQAMKLGVTDYIAKKDLTPNRLKEAIEAAVKLRSSSDRKKPVEATIDATPISDDKHLAHAPFTDASVLNGEARIMQYRLQKCIGRGGMATVYQALNEESNETVALKILDPSLMHDDRYLDRFIEEYHTAYEINHNHVVKIHEQGFTDQYTYIVMELLTGGDLKARIRKGIEPHMAVKYAMDIASALGELHDRKIIHRDLKPTNILFDENERLVMVDFGVAKVLDNHLELTRHGEAIGTPAYMSPEEIQHGSSDTRGDLYSLGVIFYHMLRGRLPFTARSAAAIMYKQVYEEVPHIGDCPADLNSILQKLLEKDPDNRYQTAQEVYNELRLKCPMHE